MLKKERENSKEKKKVKDKQNKATLFLNNPKIHFSAKTR